MSLLCYLVITCLRILNHGYYVMLIVFSQFLEVMIPPDSKFFVGGGGLLKTFYAWGYSVVSS